MNRRTGLYMVATYPMRKDQFAKLPIARRSICTPFSICRQASVAFAHPSLSISLAQCCEFPPLLQPLARFLGTRAPSCRRLSLYGCGSKNRYQNGTLVSGNMDQNLHNPSCLILTHSHIQSIQYQSSAPSFPGPLGI